MYGDLMENLIESLLDLRLQVNHIILGHSEIIDALPEQQGRVLFDVEARLLILLDELTNNEQQRI